MDNQIEFQRSFRFTIDYYNLKYKHSEQLKNILSLLTIKECNSDNVMHVL